MAKPPVVTTLSEIRELSGTVRHFRFTFDPGTGFPFKAGQFLMLHVPKPGEPPVRRAYSICSPPHEAEADGSASTRASHEAEAGGSASTRASHDDGFVEIVVKRVEGGRASNYLFGLQGQARVTVDGPYGAFVLPSPLPKHLVFVCTGTGIAPFRAQIQTLFKVGVDPATRLTLLFGVRYEDEVLYDDEWRALANAHPNFRFIPTISRPRNTPVPWTGEVGYVQTKLAQHAPADPDTKVFICGLWDMISAVENTCLELGYAKKQIHYERYD